LASLAIIIINFSLFYLGKRFCEKTTLKLAPIIYFITLPLLPIINAANIVLIRMSGKENDDVSMEEITDLVEEAHEDGAIDAGEYRLMTNVIKFGDVLISDVMTPRIVMFSCKADMTIEEAYRQPELQIYSRFPI
jgi:CBS domain containing-hemolysin-like protein